MTLFILVQTGKAHELQRNKHLAKERVQESKLNTSAFHVVKINETFDLNGLNLNYPLFVKPTSRGGGFGIDSGSVIYNGAQLMERLEYVCRVLKTDALIEEFLPGREFSVAVIKDVFTGELIAMPIELIAPEDEHGMRLLSGSVKSSNVDEAIEVIGDSLIQNLRTFGLDVFRSLGARDYGRIDVRLDEDGTPYFLEMNLIPSLITNYGSFPRACVINYDIEYDEMIHQIVELAFLRKDDTKILFVPDELSQEETTPGTLVLDII